jgi:HAD superfamily hydrolase (TIGR01509 family)
MNSVNNSGNEKIKSIIFDLGNVVFRINEKNVFRHWSKSYNVDFKKLDLRKMSVETYERFEKGLISADDYIKLHSKQMGLPLDKKIYIEGFISLYEEVFAGIPELLDRLTHYRLVSLTNTNEIHYPVWNDKYAHVLEKFERIFSSHKIFARKPEARAFEIVLEYLGSTPDETVFIDDVALNVEGARRIGLNGILFESVESLYCNLGKFGVLIDDE